MPEASRTTLLYKRYLASIGGFQVEVDNLIGTSGHVFYSPIEIPFKLTIDSLGCIHGAVAAGNFYLAIYDSLNEAPNNRLGVTASVANAGTNQKQLAALSGGNLQLEPGLYYLAIEQDNALDSHYANMASYDIQIPYNVNNGPSWYRELLAGGYDVPPATATPTQDGTCIPFCLFVRVASVP